MQHEGSPYFTASSVYTLNPDQLIMVNFSDWGQSHDGGHRLYSRFMGLLVRDSTFLPLTPDPWNQISSIYKNGLWEQLLVCYEFI